MGLLESTFRLTPKATYGKSYSSNWNMVRLRVLIRDGFKCRTCGSKESLEVHHVIPVSKGGVDTPDNLIAVCRKCHRAIHEAHKPKPLVKTLTFKPKIVLRKPVEVEKPKPKPLSPLKKRLLLEFIRSIDLPEPVKTVFLASLDRETLDLLFTGWLLSQWEKQGGSLSELVNTLLITETLGG